MLPGTQRRQPRGKLAVGTWVRSSNDVQLPGRQIRPNQKCAEKEPSARAGQELGAGGSLANQKVEVDPKRQMVCKEWRGIRRADKVMPGIWKEKSSVSA